MIARRVMDAATEIVVELQEAQRAQGINDCKMGRLTGHCHSAFNKWRTTKHQPMLRSMIAWANALGFDLVLRERDKS